MYDCNCLTHPFQNDPGISQHERVVEDLLSGAAKIDARSLADLLDYFVQLSRHINYYDPNLNISDWQSFFKHSNPFILASVINYKIQETDSDYNFYNSLFEKKPSASGLQLQVYFIYYHFISKINGWYKAFAESDLPIEKDMQLLIKDRLQQRLKDFIKYANAAVKYFSISRIDFLSIQQNDIWGLDFADIYTIDNSFKKNTTGKHEQLNNLYASVKNIYPVFLNAVKVLSANATKSLEQSFLPLKEELQKKHPPHLGLLFAFLNMFRQLQNDLNSFTRKHLDFFYKDVLQIKSQDAIADKTHVIFEIQKQLKNYLIKKGTLVKDGKDANKQDILFALDDDIVVNKTEISEIRTLFLNNQNAFAETYVEGVYTATDATKANGVDKDFTDDDPKNFPTVGSKLSKYSDPETKIIQPYPNARLGFILASPVLYLQEGTRTVNITIACELKESLCADLETNTSSTAKNCCNPNASTITDTNEYPNFFAASNFVNNINAALNLSYYYISQNLIKDAVKKGISKKLADTLKETFLTEVHTLCYCPVQKPIFDNTVMEENFKAATSSLQPGERAILADVFKPRKAFNILFSGEKDWIEPTEITLLSIEHVASSNYLLHINTVLNPDLPAVTFYNKDNLKEDFDTTQPVVKIELDDKIKLNSSLSDKTTSNHNNEEINCCPASLSCSMQNDEQGEDLHTVSLYHFFRNLEVIKKIGTDEKVKTDDTRIHVEVCGLKNFIVQNDESVQDVNNAIYPFGTRPEIIDFDVVNPRSGNKNLIGPNFYIGSKEIFFKKWEEICININWKDKPVNFNDYYKGYLVRDNYHDCTNPTDNTKSIYGLNECDFEVNLAILENGKWVKEKDSSSKAFQNLTTMDWNRHLFQPGACNNVCDVNSVLYSYSFFIEKTDFEGKRNFVNLQNELAKYKPNSRAGFLRFNLQNQDFLHKDYSFVLARQMMAFGRYPDLINDAVYVQGGIPQVFDISIFFGNIGPKIIEIASDVVNSAIVGVLDDLIQIITNEINSSVNQPLLNGIIKNCKTLLNDVVTIAAIPDIATLFSNPFDVNTLGNPERHQINTAIKDFVSDLFDLLKTNLSGIEDDLKTAIRDRFDDILVTLNVNGLFSGLFGEKQVVIPNEPWTPIIKQLSIDYTADATIEDIDLIHLYPYTGTYKHEEIELQPTLFPNFCDEGTLFLGLKNLVPGENINILFQLAEATADSESPKEEVHWYYLDSNVWKPLRKGFEVLDDASENLTTSGIIKFALPANMTSDNTVLPKDLYWIKASIAQNSKAIAETLGIHPQAIEVIFTNDAANDKLRLYKPLAAKSITRLNEADAKVKSVQQPYESFGGRIPEMQGDFYIRVSELLRHKGRAIQKFDYERIALEAFPQLFKVKCINHSFALDAHQYKNDFPFAPGYIILAVIPDLNKLKAGNSFEPKVPVSIIEKIEAYIRKRTSPFVRFRAMNPRYEKINFCLRVKLIISKDENYYTEKLKQDLRELLAPWVVGIYEKLTFGQCIYRSDIIRFLEHTDYIDYISDFRMGNESETPENKPKQCPLTPRSILVAGEIEVCIDDPDCEHWLEDENKKVLKPCDIKLIPVSNYCKTKQNR
ncbi:MAG: hypothetical protein QM763_09550 [Agriterribacter sp.]